MISFVLVIAFFLGFLPPATQVVRAQETFPSPTTISTGALLAPKVGDRVEMAANVAGENCFVTGVTGSGGAVNNNFHWWADSNAYYSNGVAGSDPNVVLGWIQKTETNPAGGGDTTRVGVRVAVATGGGTDRMIRIQLPSGSATIGETHPNGSWQTLEWWGGDLVYPQTGRLLAQGGSTTVWVAWLAILRCYAADTPTATPTPESTRTPTPVVQPTNTPVPPTPTATPVPPTPTATTAPMVPSNLVANCQADGKVRLSWDSAPGAERYAVRVDVDPVSWNGTCQSPDHCVDTSLTSISVGVRPGVQNAWWIHAIKGSTWGPSVSGPQFSCAAPTNTPTLELTNTPTPSPTPTETPSPTPTNSPTATPTPTVNPWVERPNDPPIVPDERVAVTATLVEVSAANADSPEALECALAIPFGPPGWLVGLACVVAHVALPVAGVSVALLVLGSSEAPERYEAVIPLEEGRTYEAAEVTVPGHGTVTIEVYRDGPEDMGYVWSMKGRLPGGLDPSRDLRKNWKGEWEPNSPQDDYAPHRERHPDFWVQNGWRDQVQAEVAKNNGWPNDPNKIRCWVSQFFRAVSNLPTGSNGWLHTRYNILYRLDSGEIIRYVFGEPGWWIAPNGGGGGRVWYGYMRKIFNVTGYRIDPFPQVWEYEVVKMTQKMSNSDEWKHDWRPSNCNNGDWPPPPLMLADSGESPVCAASVGTDWCGVDGSPTAPTCVTLQQEDLLWWHPQWGNPWEKLQSSNPPPGWILEWPDVDWPGPLVKCDNIFLPLSQR